MKASGSPSLSSRKLGGSHSPSTSSCASRSTAGSSVLLQESDGILKSGAVVAHFHSTKAKKSYYGVLTERSFELHESEKSQRRKKNAKYIVDLAHCFNVSLQSFPKLGRCVSLMSPDETLLLKSADGERETAEWYERALSAIIPARALHLGRPVFSNEFFECAWDVTVAAAPRLRKPVPNPDNFPNICLKLPGLAERRQRLCFYPHTIILCALGIEPASKGLPPSGIPPFSCADFIELSRQFVASFGCQEKYFIVRIGRASPTGQCEVWVQCDSEEVAHEIHAKLVDIIDREAEKKRKGLTAALGTALTSPSETAPSSSHQLQPRPPLDLERQQPTAAAAAADALPASATSLSLSTIVERVDEPKADADDLKPVRRKHSSSMSQSEREKRSVLRNYKAKVDSLEEEQQRQQIYGQHQPQTGSASAKQRHQNVEQAIAADIARSRRSAMRSGGNMDGVFLFDGPCTRNSLTAPSCSAFVIEIVGYRDSLISRSSSAAEEETEDSGGTLRMTSYEGNSRSNSSLNLPQGCSTPAFPIRAGHLVQTQVECHQTENTPPATDYLAMERGAAGEEIELSTLRRPAQPQRVEDDEDSCCSSAADSSASGRPDNTGGARKAEGENLSTTSSISTTDESLSSSHQQRQRLYRKNQQQPAAAAPPEELEGGDYTPMDKASCSSSVSHLAVPPNYESVVNPEEVSYASDSGDSCYSSMVNGQMANPRAFSFSSDIPHPTTPLPRQYSAGRAAPHYQLLSAHLQHHHESNQSVRSGGGGCAGSERSPTWLESPGSMERRHFGGHHQAPARPHLQPAAEDDPRRRTFSLGSSSWLPKPFRKLSSNLVAKHQRASASSKSDSSSLAASAHGITDSETHYGSGCLSSRQPSSSSFTSDLKTTSFITAPAEASSPDRRKPAVNSDLVELDFCGGGEGAQRSRTGSCEGAQSNSGSIRRQQAANKCSAGADRPRSNLSKYSEDAYVEQEKLRAGGGGARPRAPGKSRKADKGYALQEVRCFISPLDREKLNALLAKDSNSMSSQKTASDSSHFETIDEDAPLSSSSRQSGLEQPPAVEQTAVEQAIA